MAKLYTLAVEKKSLKCATANSRDDRICSKYSTQQTQKCPTIALGDE